MTLAKAAVSSARHRPRGRDRAQDVRDQPADGRGHLSEGVVVQATLRARLLGVRLLSVEATAVLAPADIGTIAVPARAMPASRRAPARPARAVRHRLADAVRDLDKGARLLQQARGPL